MRDTQIEPGSAGLGQPAGDVDPDAGDVVASPLHLGRVHAGPDLGAKRRQRVAEVAGGAHPAPWAVEGGQQTRCRQADQSAVVLARRSRARPRRSRRQAGQAGVAASAAAAIGPTIRRTARWREIGRATRTTGGRRSQTPHRGQDRAGVAAEHEVICAGQLRNQALGMPATRSRACSIPIDRVVAAVHDQRRNPDARQERGHVDRAHQLDQPAGRARGWRPAARTGRGIAARPRSRPCCRRAAARVQPVPQRRSTAANSGRSGSSSHGWRAQVPCRISRSTRSGWAAASRIESEPPSEEPNTVARSHAGRVHHRAYVVCPLLERRRLATAEPLGQAGPPLVEHRHPAERPQSAQEPAIAGCSHCTSTLVVNPSISTRFGPSPKTWYAIDAPSLTT